MSFSVPKGWEKDSDKLYIHNSGVRIQFMTYRAKEGWYLVPTDLDQPVLEFEPTPEGREKAFEAFGKGVLNVKTRKKAPAVAVTEPAKKRGRPARPRPEADEEEGKEGEPGDEPKDKDKDKDKEKDKDKDKDKDDEEDEEDEDDDS